MGLVGGETCASAPRHCAPNQAACITVPTGEQPPRDNAACEDCHVHEDTAPDVFVDTGHRPTRQHPEMPRGAAYGCHRRGRRRTVGTADISTHVPGCDGVFAPVAQTPTDRTNSLPQLGDGAARRPDLDSMRCRRTVHIMGHLLMRKYGFLILSSHHRAYARASMKLAQGELEVFNQAVLGGRISDVAEEVVGGASYLTFYAERLRDADVRQLSNLSSMHALFEFDDTCLHPIELSRLDQFDSDLLAKSQHFAKTDAEFTKLLFNVTAMAVNPPRGLVRRHMRVLDPLCGRGATLHQAMMYGFDAAGVEVDRKDFDAYAGFVKSWMKKHRVKHRAETARIKRERKTLGSRLHVDLSASKEKYKKGECIELDVVNADTLSSDTYFKPASFDMIVTDTPSGVQRARGDDGRGRHPMELLHEAAPAWERLVRPGGAVGIAWNTRVADRHDLASVLTGNGFAVLDTDPHLSLKHRLNQTTVRDLIVARKPS